MILRNLIIYWILGPKKAELFFEDFEDSLEDLTKEWNKATGKKGQIPEVEEK